MYSNAFAMLFDSPTKASTKSLNRTSSSSWVGGGSCLTHGVGATGPCLAATWPLLLLPRSPVGIATAESGAVRTATNDKTCMIAKKCCL